MKYYRQQFHVFSPAYLSTLRGEIFASPYFTTNNLNRDFVGTKGFSVVFQRSHLPQVIQRFPAFKPYLETALQPACNAFYLNPLLLQEQSRVDPHIDRSLRSYCKELDPPTLVSVLYVQVPEAMQGGELVLRHHKQQIAVLQPTVNTLVFFQGDLTHSVKRVTTPGHRLSLVCEQYTLNEAELQHIPTFTIESRTTTTRRSRY